MDDDNARERYKLAKLGVPASIVAHGQEPGIAAHWELWSFVRGACHPSKRLRPEIIIAACLLGYDHDVGSLEASSWLDLVILDADPSADIRNSDKISKVMIGCVFYDAATLNEEITGTRKREASASGSNRQDQKPCRLNQVPISRSRRSVAVHGARCNKCRRPKRFGHLLVGRCHSVEQALGVARRAGEVGRVVDDPRRAGIPGCIAQPVRARLSS
ncbi:MAG: hypothetical protein IPP45_16180 [Sphingomonadales bacterium]|nr:hypothetical protein [Sphingomonadales bacterium]